MNWRIGGHSQVHARITDGLAKLETELRTIRLEAETSDSQPDPPLTSRRFRIEATIAVVSLLGLLFYGTVWLGYAGYYTKLGVQAEDVGVTYAFILTRSILLIWILAMLLAGVAYLTLLGIRMNHHRLKFWLLGTTALMVAGIILTALAQRTSSRIIDIAGFTIFLWGALPFMKASTEWFSLAEPRWRRKSFRLLARISRRQVSDQRRERRVRHYSTTRRRSRGIVAQQRVETLRATWRMRFQKVTRAPKRLLLGPVCLVYTVLALTLISLGDSAANRVIEGKAPFPYGSVWQVIVAVRADPVRVRPLQSNSFPVDQSNLRFLGQREGVYFLYDIARQRPMLVSTEQVELRLLDHEGSDATSQNRPCADRSC
jgi:hypothetical protein